MTEKYNAVDQATAFVINEETLYYREMFNQYMVYTRLPDREMSVEDHINKAQLWTAIEAEEGRMFFDDE